MKNYANRGSIKQKLLSMMLVVSLVVSFIGYIIFTLWYISLQYDKKIELSKTVVEVLSQNVAKLVLLDDVKEASDITTILHSYPDINYLILYNKEKQIIYTYQKNLNQEPPRINSFNTGTIITNKDNLEIIKEAKYQNVTLGYIIINIKTKTVLQILKDDLIILMATMILFLLVSYILSSYYAKSFTKPIIRLINFLETIRLQDLDKQQLLKIPNTNDEFSNLYEKINTMLIRINKANRDQRIASTTFEIDNAMIITDNSFKILKVNNAYTKIMHYSQDEIIGKIPPVLQSSFVTENFYEKIQKTLKEEGYWSGEIKNKTKEGNFFDEHLSIYTVKNQNHEIEYYIFSFTDITKQKNIEAKLRFLQQYDSLTGLANKELATQKIKKNFSCLNGFISFDIQNFKQINEAYGYETGDILLKKIAQRIQENFSNIIVFSRLESNRFLLYLKYKKDDNIMLDINLDAEYLLSLFSKPFFVQEDKIYLRTNIGITFCTSKKTVQVLLDEVNTALEYAKKSNQNIYFFNKSLQNKTKEYLNLYSNLVKAIEENEFKVHYQLQFDKNKKPYGAEALIRWYHPQKGVIYPNIFIPLAEKTGLISQIGRNVLEAVCEQLQKWQNNPKTQNFIISVNIGSKHFMENDFVKQLENIISKYDIKANKIKLELTEYLLVDNPKKVANTMQKLKDIGFKISLDDFGTGYSSLQYLRELPLDEIKIDQTFVKNLLKNKDDETIISSILLLAKALNLDVVAEGIENEEELKKLIKLKCYKFQGFLLAPPLDKNILEEKIDSFYLS